MSDHTAVRVAEIGYLLIVIAGVWLAVTEMPQFRLARGRVAVAGIVMAVAGVLLIIATHSGHYGSPPVTQ